METIMEETSADLLPVGAVVSNISKLVDPLSQFPDSISGKILLFLPIKDLLQTRLVSKSWNYITVVEDLLYRKSCFTFDGRKDDPTASKCCSYMEESETKNSLWDYIRLRRATVRQISWVNSNINTYTITTFELLNCTINWVFILQMLMELENLQVLIDTQDTYCWDYATFNAGLDEAEIITENERFNNIPAKEKLAALNNIKTVRIHRSQLSDCTTYIKMLSLKSQQIEHMTFTTDQNFQPQRAIPMYRNLASLTQQNKDTLKSLTFPFKTISAAYDFRLTDEHHNFREFLNHIVDQQWLTNLKFPALTDLSLQYGVIPIENVDIKNKLIPFLDSLPKLSNFYLGCIYLENDSEIVIQELISDSYRTQFGIFVNDATGIVPPITSSYIESSIHSLIVQTFRPQSKGVKDSIPLLGIDAYPAITDFQYFNKNHTFSDFNLDLVVNSLCNLTHLNIVDHNSRIETRHFSEAIATIEDSDMQLIFQHLTKLVSLQLIGNMTYLTDSGMTGCSIVACNRMRTSNSYTKLHSDIQGWAISNLRFLKILTLRGLGIKITDVTLRVAFNGMTYLKKLHLYGSHQVSSSSRLALSLLYPSSRGCDVQV